MNPIGLAFVVTLCLVGQASAAVVYGFGEDDKGRKSVQSIDYDHEDGQRRRNREAQQREYEIQKKQRQCERYTKKLARLRAKGVAGAHVLRGEFSGYAEEAKRRSIKNVSRMVNEKCH